MHKYLKTGGIIALLASTLTLAPNASAINLTIGNSLDGGGVIAFDNGQSFINDPAGSGATIFLHTWTLAFEVEFSQAKAAAQTLQIFLGSGDGGSLVGSSSNTSTSTFAGFPATTWTFTGGLPIIDNQTYTAFLPGSYASRFNSTNPYPNGSITNNSSIAPNLDFVFQGTFSASSTPVPFEFSPALGLGVVGGVIAVKRLLKKKKKS